MEPEVRAFLLRILQTISLVLFWMLTNSFFGIKLGYLFLEGQLSVWHMVYYIFMIGSGIWILVYLLRKWKKAPTYDRENDKWIYPS